MKKHKYELTPEHRAQLKPWADRWIANALRTRAMDDDDKSAMCEAVEGLYRAANLIPPPRSRIVFVASPRTMAFAGGFAAAIWYMRMNGSAATDAAAFVATDAATEVATSAATSDATYDATSAATYDATSAATDAATRDAIEAATRDAASAATRAATDDATRDATHAATSAATSDATYDATNDATRDAMNARPGVLRFMLACARNWYSMANGGNHWSGWVSYISFFRHVSGLDLPIYEKWKHYESAAVRGAWRVMHPEFCIVSDFPERIMMDDRNRPHCSDGPSHRWRDGWELWHIDGVRVTEQTVLHPETLTVAQIKAEENEEVRRIMRERFGEGRYLRETKARLVDADFEGATIGAAPRALLEDEEGRLSFVGTDGSTARVYYMNTKPGVKTCRDAHIARCGFDESRIKIKS